MRLPNFPAILVILLVALLLLMASPVPSLVALLVTFAAAATATGLLAMGTVLAFTEPRARSPSVGVLAIYPAQHVLTATNPLRHSSTDTLKSGTMTYSTIAGASARDAPA